VKTVQTSQGAVIDLKIFDLKSTSSAIITSIPILVVEVLLVDPIHWVVAVVAYPIHDLVAAAVAYPIHDLVAAAVAVVYPIHDLVAVAVVYPIHYLVVAYTNRLKFSVVEGSNLGSVVQVDPIPHVCASLNHPPRHTQQQSPVKPLVSPLVSWSLVNSPTCF